jgi:hypothetical protein
MTKQNDAANQLWGQIFATLAKTEGATLCEPDYNDSGDESRIRKALALAGWSEQEIQSRVDLHRAQEAAAPVTSPGVAPHAELIFDRLCADIEATMVRLKLDSHGRVARGIEPRVGPLVGLTNVIMTDESIVTVGSFLFRSPMARFPNGSGRDLLRATYGVTLNEKPLGATQRLNLSVFAALRCFASRCLATSGSRPVLVAGPWTLVRRRWSLACQSRHKRFHGDPPRLSGCLRRGVKGIRALRPDRIVRTDDQIGVAGAFTPCAHNHPVG